LLEKFIFFSFIEASPTLNLTGLAPTNITCAIPYCLNDNQTENLRYYCSFVSFRKDLICGISSCPNITNQNSFGKCEAGYYLMITNDKFESAAGSFRSRRYSTVYSSSIESSQVCMQFRFNIYGDGDDGLRVYLENYLNPDETNLIHTERGPLPIDKWYTASVQLDQTAFLQFRVSYNIFSQFRTNEKTSLFSL